MPDAEQPIRSDAGRERAAAQIEFFRAALEKMRSAKPTRRNAEVLGKSQELLRRREAEIREYDALKRGELNLPKFTRFPEIPAAIPRIRIAKGVSQTELARRLGVSKQAISRSEESNYSSVNLDRLQQILDALGVRTETILEV